MCLVAKLRCMEAKDQVEESMAYDRLDEEDKVRSEDWMKKLRWRDEGESKIFFSIGCLTRVSLRGA